MKLNIALIRHGEIENTAGRVSGADGNPLSEDGKKLLREKCASKVYPETKHVYSSELLCCRETASLIYMLPVMVLKSLNAPYYGDFEGQASRGLFGDDSFQKTGALYESNERAKNALREIGEEMQGINAGQCAIITHKMIILAILRRYCVPRSSYADWEVSFGGGYFIEFDSIKETAIIINKI